MDREVVINGIMIENDLIGYFLDKLTKMFNGSKANEILSRLSDGNIDLKLLLEDDLGNTKEIKDLKLKLEKNERLTADYKKKYDTVYKDLRDSKNQLVSVKSENSDYLSAIRYYEDTLHGLKLRHEILNRKDLGKIFEDPSEEEGWTV